jgi:uncharacterized protein YegP (UPF0339 family)
MNTVGCHVQLFASTPTAAIRWRLLSGNNREIARGVESFADAESCRVAVKDLQESVGALESMVRQTEAHRWVWQLSDGHGVIATSAHGYDRLIRCSRGLEQFRAALPVAEISPDVMISQARRWGGGMA